MKVYNPPFPAALDSRGEFMLTELLERYKFSGSPCSCKPRMQRDLANCIGDMHHGVYGIVKQIGNQRLQNYHNERDKAAGTNIIEGPLTEEEF